eukprot:Gregarina_sp_Pseudo_9__1336@NODE_1896_length_1269_cov_45_000813_g1758_i0_p3_GENE_NODE_1896_length_1269_cov_45_000813_g1758_i0NODE_1896_length_1269_cov_45_000813_g1758_i0_p3_ORF_typecomplete_len164_score33_67NDK/PF00334_19/4_7e44_NODE_1896_length_1269_cov_45_000813_g1758_i0114605
MWQLFVLLKIVTVIAVHRTQTLVLVKPDAVAQRHVGRIISHFEDAGLRIDHMRLLRPSQETLRQHYKEHVGREYYAGLEQFMMEGPIVAMALSNEAGDDSVIARVRLMMGQTDSRLASPGTIRYMFGTDKQRNVLHASEDKAEAERELSLWFPQSDGGHKDEL